MKSGAIRPRFEDEVWSLKGWADAPVQMKSPEGNWNFGRVHHPAWRVVAKELCLSWLASKDERVLALPRARLVPRHPRTVWSRLYLLSFWFNWLHERRVTTLAAVTQDNCDAFVQEYGVVRDETGAVIRPKSANSLRSLVSGMQEISDYADVLSADRYRAGFRPWGERSPREITGTPSRPDIQIKTPPLPDEVLSPLLSASLLLVEVLGPHIAELRRTLRADRDQWNTAKQSRYLRMNEQDETRRDRRQLSAGRATAAPAGARAREPPPAPRLGSARPAAARQFPAPGPAHRALGLLPSDVQAVPPDAGGGRRGGRARVHLVS